MAIKIAASLKSFFESGDVPTCAQFVDLIDSTYSGEIGANIVSAAAVSAGVLRIDSASAVTILDSATAGEAILAANAPVSVRTILSAGSAGEAVFLAGTQASARTAIDVTAATTAKAGLIEIATTAETRAGIDGSRAIAPATLPVIQTVHTQTGAVATGTTTIPRDDTIPQNTEGDEYISLAITPTNTSNRLVIDVVINVASSIGGLMIVALFQDSTANALASVAEQVHTLNSIMNFKLRHEMAAGTTSATTFKVRVGQNNAGTTTFNGESGARILGGVLASSITIKEIKT